MGYGDDKIPFASLRGHSETNALGIFQGKGKEATERESVGIEEIFFFVFWGGWFVLNQGPIIFIISRDVNVS